MLVKGAAIHIIFAAFCCQNGLMPTRATTAAATTRERPIITATAAGAALTSELTATTAILMALTTAATPTATTGNPALPEAARTTTTTTATTAAAGAGSGTGARPGTGTGAGARARTRGKAAAGIPQANGTPVTTARTTKDLRKAKSAAKSTPKQPTTPAAVDYAGGNQNLTNAPTPPAMSYHQFCLVRRNSIGAIFMFGLYTVVCIVGLCGNSLVIYVILRFSKMKTVTNIYILNLAVADECFLIGIPFLLYTMRLCSWRFGDFVCKAYMVSTSITQFTSSIFLLIMSADRYIAVCHPIRSPRYRTLFTAKLVSFLAWFTSALLMLPVMLFANTVQQGDGVHLSCNIDWPELYKQHAAYTFISYTLILGFALPLCFIMLFYFLVLKKLAQVGAKHKSKEKRRSHRKVTRLVLTVITVYVFCWLPHWVSQVVLITRKPDAEEMRKEEQIIVFLLLGCMSYSNSAMNPILYAFLSENFRKSFWKAFTCMTRRDVNAQLQPEQSSPSMQTSRKRSGSKRQKTAAGKDSAAPKEMLQLKSGGGVTGEGGGGAGQSSAATSSTNTAPEHVNATMGTNTCTSSSGAATIASSPKNGRAAVLGEDTILMLDEQEQTVAIVVSERTCNLRQTDF